MIDSIDELILAARKEANSKYTRSAKKAQWTRPAGQLIWYKDSILRAMTYEALEADVHRLLRKVFQDEDDENRARWQALMKKSEQASEEKEDQAKFWEKKIGPKSAEPKDSSAATTGQSP